MSTTSEDLAAAAVIDALMDWFVNEESNPGDHLNGHNAGDLAAILFGLLVATIRTASELADTDPLDYVRLLSLNVAMEAA